MKVTILGCGGSGGVPLIGNRWGACDPAEPRNRRRRCSILVEWQGTTILVDTSPDLREQLLDAGVQSLDAVLWTHAHADHAHGIDDLRQINRLTGRALPAYADGPTLARLREAFGYVLEPLPEGTVIYRPFLDARLIDGPFQVGPVTVVPFEQDHGYSRSLGFRFGPLAYSPDVVRLPEASFAALEGVDTWIVDCLRDEPHETHSWTAQTLDWIERVGARHGILTHLGEHLDYADLKKRLPSHVEPAYDGMVLEIISQLEIIS